MNGSQCIAMNAWTAILLCPFIYLCRPLIMFTKKQGGKTLGIMTIPVCAGAYSIYLLYPSPVFLIPSIRTVKWLAEVEETCRKPGTLWSHTENRPTHLHAIKLNTSMGFFLGLYKNYLNLHVLCVRVCACVWASDLWQEVLKRISWWKVHTNLNRAKRRMVEPFTCTPTHSVHALHLHSHTPTLRTCTHPIHTNHGQKKQRWYIGGRRRRSRNK